MEMLVDAVERGVDPGDQRVCVSGNSHSEIRLVGRQRHKHGGARR